MTKPGNRHRPSTDHDFYANQPTAAELIARLVFEAKAAAARAGR